MKIFRAYLQLSLLFTNSPLSSCEIKKKIPRMDSEKKVYEILCPVWDDNVPFRGQKEFCQLNHYCHFCLVIVTKRAF